MNSFAKKMCFKTAVVMFAAVVSGGVLCACGSDSSSTEDDEFEEIDSSDSQNGSSSSLSSGSVGSVTEVESLDISQYAPSATGTVSTEDGKTYKTVNVGPVTWMVENINSGKSLATKSTCYGYDDRMCETYGRLYMDNDYSAPQSVCPEGFSIPSVGVWEELVNSEVDFSPVFAGVCDKKDTLKCDNLQKSVRYLATGGRSIIFTKDSSGKVSHRIQQSNYSNEFYSVRCVKYHSIVAKMSDLPECDSRLSGLPTINVLEKEAAYDCSASSESWTKSSYGGKCLATEKGDFFLYDSLELMVCKNGLWEHATMLDVSVSCDEKNLYQEYTLNSSRYVCTEEDGWLRLSYPSSVLGYCHEKVWGTIAKTSDTTDSYMCDSLGWRKATVQDVHGKCTMDVAYKVVEFDSVKYMCLPSRSWHKETTVDSALGFCTKALDDSAKIYNDNFYRCSRGEWIRVDNYDYLGTCNNMTVWDSVHVGSLVYVCNEWPSWQLQEYAGEYGLCTMDNLGAVVNGSFGVRICKEGYRSNMAWEPANAIEAEVGYCADDTTFAVVTDSLCYYCNSGTWKTGTCQLSDYIGDCSSRAAGVIDTVYKGVEYVCDTSASLLGWHKMTAIDSLYGYCRTAIIGKTYDYTDSTSLVCNKVSSEKKWVEVAKDTTSASAED